MPRHRARLIGWTYDDSRQEIRTPHGRIITLHDVAQMLADHRDCRFDFAGPWTGWRMRGDRLIPPHAGQRGPALKPDTAPLFARWISAAAAPPAVQHTRSIDRPHLWLAYTSNR